MTAALAVRYLSLTDFRSWPELKLTVDSGLIVITGPNGAGKTNLLEALSFLVPGRGIRGTGVGDIARMNGPGGWAVAARLETASGLVDITTGCLPSAGSRRQVYLDGRLQKSQLILGDFSVMTWLTPAMDRLFLEGASGRRRFLDRLSLAFDPAHAACLSRHERAMRQRLRLLREGGRVDPAWLSALETEMATQAVAAATTRLEIVRRIGQIAQDGYATLSKVQLAVTGPVESLMARVSAENAQDVREQLLRGLVKTRRLDQESGTTALGAHRSDLEVVLLPSGMPVVRASTGEQKAVLIAILLAASRITATVRRIVPVLLLDEIAAHLDPLRREALFSTLQAEAGQVWLTGTEAAPFSPLGSSAQWFNVADGNVCPVDPQARDGGMR